MNGNIKLCAKQKMLGKTAALFTASFIAFALTAVAAAVLIAAAFFLFRDELFKPLVNAVGGLPANLIVFAVLWILRFIVFVFASGIHAGETFLYITASETGKIKHSHIFSFLAPKKAFRFFRLYLKLALLKGGWLLLYMFPATISGISAYLMVFREGLFSKPAYIMMIAATSLTATGIMFFFANCTRYRLCTYIALKKPELSVNEIIFASIDCTDSHVSDSTLFGFSMFGWRLLSFIPFACVYALPYCKLAAVEFTEDIAERRAFSAIHEISDISV